MTKLAGSVVLQCGSYQRTRFANMAGFTTFPLEGEDKEQVLNLIFIFLKTMFFQMNQGAGWSYSRSSWSKSAPLPLLARWSLEQKTDSVSYFTGMYMILAILKDSAQLLCITGLCRTFERLSWTPGPAGLFKTLWNSKEHCGNV